MLDQWQEAYKAIDDVATLMERSMRTPKPQTLANYFTKLVCVCACVCVCVCVCMCVCVLCIQYLFHLNFSVL